MGERSFILIRIVVEIAKGGRSNNRDRREPQRDGRRSDYRIIITGLSPSTTWQELKDQFRKAGDVQYSNMERNGDGS